MSLVRTNDVRVERVKYRENVRVSQSTKKTVRNNEIFLQGTKETVRYNEVSVLQGVHKRGATVFENGSVEVF